MATTTAKGVPYPEDGDLVTDTDEHIQALAEWVNARPGIAALTTVERDALAGGALWTGRLIYNTTTERLERYNGTNWRGVIALDFVAAGAVTGAVPVLQADGTVAWGQGTALVEANRRTASYTLVLADASKVIEMNLAGANNLTVPPNSTVAFPVGTVINVMQYGAGQTTIVAGAGVTLRYPPSLTLKIEQQYAEVSLRKIAADEWSVVGQLEPV